MLLFGITPQNNQTFKMPPKRRPGVKKEEAQDFANLVSSDPNAPVKRELEGDLESCDLDCEQLPPTAKKPRTKGKPRVLSMKLKAVKAREKSLADKLHTAQDQCKTMLEKDKGKIVVDCLSHSREKAAPVGLYF